MGRTRASRTVCLRRATHSARTDTIGTLAARVRLRLVLSRSHDVPARHADNLRRTDCYLGISQVGFAEFDNTADNRANIGGTIIGAPIVGQ